MDILDIATLAWVVEILIAWLWADSSAWPKGGSKNRCGHWIFYCKSYNQSGGSLWLQYSCWQWAVGVMDLRILEHLLLNVPAPLRLPTVCGKSGCSIWWISCSYQAEALIFELCSCFQFWRTWEQVLFLAQPTFTDCMTWARQIYLHRQFLHRHLAKPTVPFFLSIYTRG